MSGLKGAHPQLLAPFAPFTATELWKQITTETSDVHKEAWPAFKNVTAPVKALRQVAVQVRESGGIGANRPKVSGRVKTTVDVAADTLEDEETMIRTVSDGRGEGLIVKVREQAAVAKHIDGKTISRVVVAPNRKVINFVLKTQGAAQP